MSVLGVLFQTVEPAIAETVYTVVVNNHIQNQERHIHGDYPPAKVADQICKRFAFMVAILESIGDAVVGEVDPGDFDTFDWS